MRKKGISVRPGGDHLLDILDQAPSRILNQARDYRRDDRLGRRLRVGTSLYTAELVGYQDRYHPAVRFDTNPIVASCTCSRGTLCAHAAALVLDLREGFDLYPELPWALRPLMANGFTAWLLDQSFPWERIPKVAPAWRLPPTDRAPDWLLAGDATAPLSRDGAAEIFADMHPAWLQNADVHRQVAIWRDQRLTRERERADLWVQLAWCQPALPLNPVWMAFADDLNARLALVRQLGAPPLFWESTPARRVSMLKALTLVDPATAIPCWEMYRSDDPHRLAQADSLYLAGDGAGACRVLEEHLPQDPEARIEARVRLITWLSPAEALPHRLALALETGNSPWATQVRGTVDPDAWDLFSRAFGERWQVSPEDEDSQ